MADISSIIERIRALSERTVANGCTEAEALSAAQLMGELLDKYGITHADLKDDRSQPHNAEMLDAEDLIEEIAYCSVSIAEYFDCQSWLHDKRRLTFFGLPQDVFAAATLARLISYSMERAWTGYRTHQRRLPLGWQKDPLQHALIRRAYLSSMGARIDERLQVQKQAFETAARNRHALVVAKKEIIEHGLDELGIELQEGEALPFGGDFHAEVAGAAAGRRADIGNPYRVET